MKPVDRNLSISGNTQRSCSSCMYFRTTQAGYPHDDGACSAYDEPVRSDFMCDTFFAGHDDDEPFTEKKKKLIKQ